SGTQRRDFMDVRDIGRCLAALLASETEGAVNIASGLATPVVRIAELLAGILGRPDLIELGALPSPLHEPASLVGDNRRLLSEVGVAPGIALEQGLADAVAWWRPRL